MHVLSQTIPVRTERPVSPDNSLTLVFLVYLSSGAAGNVMLYIQVVTAYSLQYYLLLILLFLANPPKAQTRTTCFL